MKITIDTAHDSEMDIRKVITLLSTLVDRSGTTGAVEEQRPMGAEGNVFSLFDQPAAGEKEEKAAEPAEKTEGEKEQLFKIDGLERY